MRVAKTVSIVIPIYNKWSLTHQCLFDIFQKCFPVDEVIIVNDNSPDPDVYTGLEWWKQQEMLPIREIRLEKNVMFLKATNIGLKKATGDIIITTSNDVRIFQNISQAIINLLNDDDQQLIGGRLLDWDTGWNTFGTAMFPYLEGWLLAATRSGWADLGYFDEQYAPSDMEDVDLSATAGMMGYKLTALPSDMTQHLGAQSIGYNPEREKITLANKEKFRKKWIEI